MRSFFSTLIIALAVLTGLLAPAGEYVSAQEETGEGAPAETSEDGSSIYDKAASALKKVGAVAAPGGALAAQAGSAFADQLVDKLIAKPAGFLLRILSLFMGLAGLLLDEVMELTVLSMSDNIGDSSTIDDTWSILRDFANMGFIFILLYVAIRTILNFGTDKSTIVNIIIVALLMNFSLFFTKVVIDVSNVLAVGFYELMVETATDTGAFFTGTTPGLSGAIMQQLGLTQLYDMSPLGTSLLAKEGLTYVAIHAVGSSIILVVAMFAFLAIALMFLVRYVMLILLMVLSPLAFAAFALPGLRSKAHQWFSTLTSQAFFAPIFMILAWVTLRVMGGILPASPSQEDYNELWTAGVSASVPTGSVNLAISFILIIMFLLASLVAAKSASDKGAKATADWGLKFASGTMGKGGRLTAGRFGSWLRRSEYLKNKAEQGGAASRWASRLALRTGKGMSEASYDVRGKGGGAILGAAGLKAGEAQKGGREKELKDIGQRYKERADLLKPDKEMVSEAEMQLEDAKGKLNEARQNVPQIRAAQQNLKAATQAEKQASEQKDREERTLEAYRKDPNRTAAEIRAQEDRVRDRTSDLNNATQNLKQATAAAKQAEAGYQREVDAAQKEIDRIKGINEKDAEKRGVKPQDSLEKRRKSRLIEDEQSFWANRSISNELGRLWNSSRPAKRKRASQVGISEIHGTMKEKGSKEIIEELYKKQQAESGEAEGGGGQAGGQPQGGASGGATGGQQGTP